MTPEQIEDARAWLKDHKAETRLTWKDLAKPIGIAEGSLTNFAGGTYNAPNGPLAEKVIAYRETLSQIAVVEAEMPPSKPYFETPSARKMQIAMNWAHSGLMTLITTGPGTSKTTAAEEYRARHPNNVWLATMFPSSGGINTMQQVVLRAMGEKAPKGTPLALSLQIIEIMRGSRGLLILDEIQNLQDKALEEVRSWFDATGTGICLMGNEDVSNKLFLSGKQSSYARLASRIRHRVRFTVPSAGDAAAFLDAWEIEDAATRRFVTGDVIQRAGGLRAADSLVRIASMIPRPAGAPLTLRELKPAWAEISTRQVAA